jgi:hypothetical protein
MDKKQILQSVVSVINDPNFNQAVLIDGEWGSGKTYFIRNELKSVLEGKDSSYKLLKTYKVGYFSMYGVTDVDELKSRILMFILLSKNKIKKIDEDSSSRYYNITSVLLKTMQLDIKSIPSMFRGVDSSDHILIFDDLERCSLPVNQMLGFINSFSEHTQTKVIVVSNQKEVGLIIDGTDLPDKYAVVLNDKLIIQNDNNGKKENENKKTAGTFTIEELDIRTKALFSRNTEYERVKEKLIGLTIRFIPDLDEIFDSLIGRIEYQNTQVLKDNKKLILDNFANEKCINIRTLAFCISIISEIMKFIKNDFGDSEFFSEIVKNVIEYTSYLSIKLKSGSFTTVEWEGNTTFVRSKLFSTDEVDFSNGRYVYIFKFVDDFAQYRSTDAVEINQTLTQFIDMRKRINKSFAETQSLSLIKLQNFFDYDDHQITKYLEELKKEIGNGKYDVGEYQRIISILAFIKESAFSVSMDDYIDLMTKNIYEGGVDSASRFGIWHSLDTHDDKNAIYYKKIGEAINRIKISNLICGLNGCLESVDWGDKIENFVQKHREDFLNQNRFLSLFESVLAISNHVKESNSKQIRSLHHAIENVYSFSNLRDFFIPDQIFVSELLSELKQLEFGDNLNTKKVALKYLIIKLEWINLKLATSTN